MDKQELQEAIVRVRAELEHFESSDPEAKPKLEKLLADLEIQAETGVPPNNIDELLAGISTEVRRFEVEHPNLTGSLGQLMMALSSMGI